MNITVYLGANEGNDPALKQAVQELGRWIGESGNALVYGGSRCARRFPEAVFSHGRFAVHLPLAHHATGCQLFWSAAL